MQTSVPAPITPPAPPVPGQVIIRPGVDAPQAVYRAFNEQRKELSNQLNDLEGKRRDLARQMGEPSTDKTVKSGLELRVAELDKTRRKMAGELATFEGRAFHEATEV